MTNHDSTLPIFPTNAPAVFCDADATSALFADALARLAEVVDIDETQLALTTPCDGFTAEQLQSHVLGWLQYFAAALLDPDAAGERPDPDAFTLADGELASDVVRRAADDLSQAIKGDAASSLVTMQTSRMAGDAVLAMALGEYLIHAWDVAVTTGQAYSAPADAAAPAHEFLLGMVAPEYRGPDTGFFDVEVPVAEDAAPFDRLLGFAGRDPQWTAAS